ncbi:hypothetical protein PEBR_02973 [Penicillium brasilianum]|uniref:Rhodopsin domain-containing protein n=1 Tax=Penicillium brasilianum TaxID=104259 RepID=A0A1S9RZC8_PENBI|nr:hypothetical protein PEBR_02973 [Penicillium brasilianum]
MNHRGSQLAAIVICFLILAVTAVALRCYVRLRLTKGFGADDALSVATLIIFMLGSACLLVGVGIGGFGHRWMDISQPKLILTLKAWTPQVTSGTTLILVKLSISLFLLRFTIERKYTWTLYVVLATILSYSVFLLFYALFQCRPVSAFWTNSGYCNRVGTVKVTYAHSAIISASDWTLIIVPIFMVYHLNLGFRTKIYLGGILALGSWYVATSCPCGEENIFATDPQANSASIATMARFAYIHDLIDPRNLLYSTGLIITSHLEIGVALTASSAATLRPLLVRLGVHSRHGQSQLSDQRHLDGGENARRHPSPEQSDLNLGE